MKNLLIMSENRNSTLCCNLKVMTYLICVNKWLLHFNLLLDHFGGNKEHRITPYEADEWAFK